MNDPLIIQPFQTPARGVAQVPGSKSITNRALILAVDAPTLTLHDLAPLLEPLEGAYYDAYPLPMVLPLAAIDGGAKTDWPLRRLVEGAGLKSFQPTAEIALRLRGANTPEERAALAEINRLGQAEG